MAGVINKIRERSALVIGITLLSLVIFIITGAVSNVGLLFGSDTGVVGRVGGKELTYPEFTDQVDAQVSDYTARGIQLENAQRKEVGQQIWNQWIGRQILEQELKHLDLSFSSNELYNELLVSDNPSPLVRENESFRDPNTGQYSKERVRQILQTAATDPNLQAQVKVFEDVVVLTRQQEMYSNLLSKGLVVSSARARRQSERERSRRDFAFLAINFSSLADSTVPVSRAEIEAYFRTHAGRYRLPEPQTVLEFVSLPKLPNGADSTRFNAQLTELKSTLATQADDTSWVAAQTEGTDSDRWVRLPDLSVQDQGVLDTLPLKAVAGPLAQGYTYRLLKVVGTKPDSVVSVNLRHLVIRPQGRTAADSARARALADSLARVVTDGNFRELVTQYSADPGTRFTGGELGWVNPEARFGPGFARELKNAPVGRLRRSITSTQGFHVVEIKRRSDVLLRLLTVEKTLGPSNQTVSSLNQRANALAARAEVTGTLQMAAEESGLSFQTSPPLRPSNAFLPGLQDAGEVTTWALTQAKKGELSRVFSLPEAFVVARVASKSNDRLADLDQVATEIETLVRNEKKVKLITAQLKKLNTQGGLDSLAGRYGQGAYVQTATGITLETSNIPGLGADPLVLGTAFGLPMGIVSQPVAGKAGVYVVQVMKIEDAPAVPAEELKANVQARQQQEQGQFLSRLYQGLREALNIVDFRYKYGL